MTTYSTFGGELVPAEVNVVANAIGYALYGAEDRSDVVISDDHAKDIVYAAKRAIDTLDSFRRLNASVPQ